MTAFLEALGARTLRSLSALGHAAFFFLDLLRFTPLALRRFDLVIVQIHAIGYRSLVIITASGLAVGCVLALQMYYALVRTALPNRSGSSSTCPWCASSGRWSPRCCSPAARARR